MKKINNIISAFSIAMLVILSVVVKAQTQAAFRTAGSENKVAILPMTYVADGGIVRTEEMRYHLQNIAYQYLKEDAMELKFQDPAETNAILLKKGIKGSGLREYTPRELAEILKVEYVLIGLVNRESTGLTTYSNTKKEHSHKHWSKHEKETKGRTRTMEQWSTTIDLDIYNDRGEKIFSRSRHSFLSTVDAYKNGLHYLLKRCPLHKR